jgi:CYTH domain-containing protein
MARRERLFAALDREWRAGGLDALARVVEELVAALEARAGGRIENERKFLLSAVPPRAQEVAAVHIAQGWLPGERVRERIRRVADDGGDRYWRGIKQGAGPQRLETEEEIPRAMFEALWPLTEGRRIAKTRRKVTEGRLTWEIDEFEGRNLVLAEVELPSRDVAAALPEWLQPFVVRDVTDDPAYLSQNLAHAAERSAAPVPEAETPPGESGAPAPLEDAPPPIPSPDTV